MAQSQPNYR
jgi:predicted  nucleic acid-binding Zn-ribbon protein